MFTASEAKKRGLIDSVGTFTRRNEKGKTTRKTSQTKIEMSNIFQNIRTGLIKFFGKPDATDVELNQMVSELPSVESLAVAANEAAETKYEDKLKAQADQIASLEAQLTRNVQVWLKIWPNGCKVLNSWTKHWPGKSKQTKSQISALSKDFAASKALYRPKDQPADAPIPQSLEWCAKH